MAKGSDFRKSTFLFVLAMVCPLLANSGAALAQDANSARITAPKEGDSLFGLVTIQGTAANANMQRYVLEFDQQDTGVVQWFPIAGPITQQVTSGVLGQWNTTTVPDGRYEIRLRVVLRDGTVISDVVQNLHVSNKQPTPLPTALPSPTALQPTALPTAGPSPTPIVQQPPTSTSHPAVIPTVIATLIGQSDPGSVPDAPAIAGMIGSIQAAFCNGMLVALVAFALIGGYSVIHNRLRPAIRRVMSQVDHDR
ncbi:MAG TPA: hypothetical protein VKQ72_13115 [Aggregatilineales bacterium]|nr:hypothetical protein [Aggregatilineales bacterium]